MELINDVCILDLMSVELVLKFHLQKAKHSTIPYLLQLCQAMIKVPGWQLIWEQITIHKVLGTCESIEGPFSFTELE